MSEVRVEKAVRRDKGHWAGWVAAMVVIGAVVGGVVILFLKFDGPSEGTVSAKSLPQLQASASLKPVSPNRLGGLNIEFDYPALFDTVGQVKTDAQAIEQYNIASKSDYRRVIAVSVRPLASGKLEDDSSYRFRQVSRDDYTMSPDKIGSEVVMIAIKADRQEQTLFWAYQGKEVTVSITTSNPNKDDLSEYMKVVKASLRWRR